MEQVNIDTMNPDTGNDKYIHSKPLDFCRRIGSTVYDVEVFVKKDTADTVEEKVLRILKNDLNLAYQNDKMRIPQTEQLPERIPS